MTTENQTIADLPMWVVIAIALAGLTGEMLRADHAGVTGWTVVRRIALRAGASVMAGGAAGLLVIAGGGGLVLALAAAILSGLMGADVAIALWQRRVMRRVDACEQGSPK